MEKMFPSLVLELHLVCLDKEKKYLKYLIIQTMPVNFCRMSAASNGVISFYLCTFRSFAVSVPILFDIVYFYFVIDCKLNEDKKYSVCSFQNILENCFSRLFNFYTYALCPLQFCFNNYLHYGIATNSFK